MELSIGRGRPEDYYEASELIYSSGPDVFDFLFTKTLSKKFLSYAFRSGRGFLSHRRHQIVKNIAGDIVGVGSAYGWFLHKVLTLYTIIDIFSFFSPREAIRILVRCMTLEKIRKPPTLYSLYFCNFGVKDEYQSKGVGTVLFVRRCRIYAKYPIKTYICDVSETNVRV